MYGHTHKVWNYCEPYWLLQLAEAVKRGSMKVPNVNVRMFQVPETLNAETLKLMNAPPKPDIPIISPNDLPKADGIIFGFPTRFGMMSSQMKSFFDSTGSLWAK